MDDNVEPVQVFIRIRPEGEFDPTKVSPSKIAANGGWASMESLYQDSCVCAMDSQTIKLMPPDDIYGTRKTVPAVDHKIYTFDHIFPEASSQEDLYAAVSDKVLATVKGYNTTIFAYGVTGSGKSYTMTGTKAQPGIIPRAIGDIFKHIDKAASESDIFFFVRLSYVELYNNNFRNLLENVSNDFRNFSRSMNSSISMSGLFTDFDDVDLNANESHNYSFARSTTAHSLKDNVANATKSEKIEVRESQNTGIYLSGSNLRFPVTSAIEAFQLIAKGNKNRAVASTNCNEYSSRSHAILTFHVESRIMNTPNADTSSKAEMRIGKIHLVDLAGSERLSLSGAEGDTLVETKSINSSLTALGDVLAALSRNAQAFQKQQKSMRASAQSLDFQLEKTVPTLATIPYRNSKLTHLLKDSLGGNSKTIMITTIRKSNTYYQQTYISLMYSSRAKKVKNRSIINRNRIGDSGIHNVNNEIERLKKSLEDRALEFERLRLMQMKDAKENDALKYRLQELTLANDAEKKLLEQQVSQLIHSQAGQIASHKEKISHLQLALKDELSLSQNRIVEQEQEIKRLKQALDENNYVSAKDEAAKWKAKCEALQVQNQELTNQVNLVLTQAELLREENLKLGTKSRLFEEENIQLKEELNDISTESNELTERFSIVLNERDEAKRACDTLVKTLDEVKNLASTQNAKLQDKEMIIKENEKLIKKLQEENGTLSKDLKVWGQRLKDAEVKLKEFSQENQQLREKLQNTIEAVHSKTTEIVEEKNSQYKALLQNRDHLAAQYQVLQEEHKNLQDKLVQQTNQSNKSLEELQIKFDNILKSNQEDQNTIAKLNARVLTMEGENEGLRDKIERMKIKHKEFLDQQTNSYELERQELIEEFNEQKKKEQDELLQKFEEILANKHKEYISELEALESKHETDLKSKEQEFGVLLQTQQDDYRRKLNATEAELEDMVEHKMQELMTQHKQELSDHHHAHQNELQALRQSLLKSQDEKIQALEKNHHEELTTLNQLNQKEIQIQKQLLLQEIDLLKDQHREDQKKIAEEHEEILRLTVQTKQKEFKQEFSKQEEVKVQSLQEEFNQILNSELEMKAKEYQTLLNQKQLEAEQRLESVKHELISKYEQEKRQLQSDFISNKEEEVQKLMKKLNQAIDDKERELEELEKTLTKQRLDNENVLKTALIQQKQQLHDEYHDALAAKDHDLADLESSYQSKLNNLIQKQADELANQRNQIEAQYKLKYQEFEDQLKLNQEKYQDLLLQKQNLEEQLVSTPHDIAMEYESKIQSLKTQLKKDLEEEKNLVIQKYQQEISLLHASIDKLTNQHVNEYASLQDQSMSEINQMKSRLQEQYQGQLEELKKTFDQKYLGLQSQHTLLQENYESLQNESQNKIEEYKVQIFELNSSYSSLKQDQIDLTQQLNKIQGLYKIDKESWLAKELQWEKKEEDWASHHENEKKNVLEKSQELLTQQAHEYEEQIHGLQSNIENFRHLLDSMEQEQKTTKEQYNQLIVRFHEEETSVQHWKHEFEDLQQTVQELKETYIEEKQKLESKLTREKEDIQIKSTHIKEHLEQKLETLQLEKIELQNTTNSKIKSLELEHLQAIQDMKKDTSVVHSHLEEKMESYIHQIQDLKSLHQQQLTNVQQETQELQLTLNELHLEIQQLQDDKDALTQKNKLDLKTLEEIHKKEIETIKSKSKEDRELQEKQWQSKYDMLLNQLDSKKEHFESKENVLKQEIDNLKTMLSDIRQHRSDDMTSYHQEITNNRQTIAQLNNQLKELDQSKLELKGLLEQELKQKLSQQQTHWEELVLQQQTQHKEELKTLQDVMNKHQLEYDNQLTEMKTQYEFLIQQLKTQQLAEIEELTQAMVADRNRTNQLIQQYHVEKADLLLQIEVDKQKLKDQTANMTKDETTRELQNKFDVQIQVLKKEWANETESKLQQQEAHWQDEISIIQKRLQQNNKDSYAQMDEIEKKYQGMLSQKDDLVSKLTQQNNSLQLDSQDKSLQIRTLQRDIEHQNKQNEILTQDQSKTLTTIESMRQEKLQLQSELDTLQWEGKQKQLQFSRQEETYQTSINSLQKQLEAFEKQIQLMQTKAQDDSNNFAEISEKLAESLSQHQELQLQYDNLQEGVARQDKLLQEYQQSLTQKQSLIQDYDDRLTKETQAHDSLAHQLTEQQTLVRQLQSEINDQKNESQSLSEKVKSLQTQLRMKESEFHTDMEEKQLELEERITLTIKNKDQEWQKELSTQLEQQQSKFQQQLSIALESQKNQLHEEHMQSIRQQMDYLMQMIQAQMQGGPNSTAFLQDMQTKFMDLVKDLPDIWKEKHGLLFKQLQEQQLQQKKLETDDSSLKDPHYSEIDDDQFMNRQRKSQPRTPVYVLANATGASNNNNDSSSQRPFFDEASHRLVSAGRKLGHQLPWSSPSLRASPTDQLIAAILDGDVQGIRTVVRSKGDGLQSDFWQDLAKSVLPLHRAISGLHFHGSEKLLIATIEVLVQLGADIHAIDHAGNGLLHKAIQICTSKSVSAVVQCLLNRGANPNVINKEGDTPLHTECKRVRAASADVIESLIAAGCNPNIKNQSNALLTPLTLVLLRGASTTSLGSTLISNAGSGYDGLANPSSTWSQSSTSAWPAISSRGLRYSEEETFEQNEDGPATGKNPADAERARSAGRKVWIKAAEMLMKSGAHWDATWRSQNGCSQLHLLLAAFPPSREDSSTYRALLKSALEHGVNPALEDDKGRNALFILCEQMATIPSDQCPDASRLVHYILDHNPQYGIGSSDRSGRTIFDIHDSVPQSCLAACRNILLQASSRSKDYVSHMMRNSTKSTNSTTNQRSLNSIPSTPIYESDYDRKIPSSVLTSATNRPTANSAIPPGPRTSTTSTLTSSRNYFEDDEDDDHLDRVISSNRASNSALASLAANRNKPLPNRGFSPVGRR